MQFNLTRDFIRQWVEDNPYLSSFKDLHVIKNQRPIECRLYRLTDVHLIDDLFFSMIYYENIDVVFECNVYQLEDNHEVEPTMTFTDRSLSEINYELNRIIGDQCNKGPKG